MSFSICFFVSTTGVARNDNRSRLPDVFAAHGWRVAVHDHQAVNLTAGRVCVGREARALDTFDLIWLVGLGTRASFIDRMQILATLEPSRFVTSAPALLEWHAKYRLALGPFAEHHPESHASADPVKLRSIIDTGGRWIVKPPAGSYGQDVYVVTRDDPNLAVILESLTGHDGSRYCLLQRYVEEIERGEKRVLIANGELIGCYLRRASADHRVNLAADGRAEPAELTVAEESLAMRVGEHLATRGIRFAAVDVAYPYVIEYNVANPGGLETLRRVTGVDPSPRVVSAIARLVR